MKGVVVLLVVVVALFAVAVACPDPDGPGAASREKAWSQRLGRLFLGATPRLPPADIRWEDERCLQGDVLVVTLPCRGRVRGSERPVRGASLRLVAGARADVAVEPAAGSDALPGRIVLVPGAPKALRVFKAGATLTVTCASPLGGTCRVEFWPPGE